MPPRSRLAPKPGSAGEGKRPDLPMKMDEIVREAGWDWPTGGAPTARRPVARAGRGYADPQAVARSADKQPAAAMLEGRLGARRRWRRRRRCSASFCPPDPGAIIRLWNGCGRPESPPAHRAARSAQSAYPAPLPSAWRRQRAGQAAPRRWRRRRCGGAVAEEPYAMVFWGARPLLRPRRYRAQGCFSRALQARLPRHFCRRSKIGRREARVRRSVL